MNMNRDILNFVTSVNRRTLTNNRQRSLVSLVKLQSKSPTGWVTLSDLRKAHIPVVALRDLRREKYESLSIECQRTEDGVFYRLNPRHSLTRIQRVFQC